MDFSNNRIDTQRRTAVYVRISTSMQKTDRQVECNHAVCAQETDATGIDNSAIRTICRICLTKKIIGRSREFPKLYWF